MAGCSLAVAVGGGLVDRKRPFTLLRVGGIGVGVLSEVVLLEAAVPLVAATVLAAGIAYGTSVLAFVRLAPAGTAIPQLGHDYYALMGVGLVIAFARDRGDAAAAAPDDRARQRPLRVSVAERRVSAGIGG